MPELADDRTLVGPAHALRRRRLGAAAQRRRRHGRWSRHPPRRPDQGHPEAAHDRRRAARSWTGSCSVWSATASATSTSASTTSPTGSRSTSATARVSAAPCATCARTRTDPLGTAGSLTLLRDEQPDLERAGARHERRPDGRVRRRATCSTRHRRTGARRDDGDAHLPARGALRRRRERPDGPRHRASPRSRRSSFEINAAVYAVEPRALAWLPDRARRARCRGWSRRASRATSRSTAWPITERLDRRRHPQRPRPREGPDVSPRPARRHGALTAYGNTTDDEKAAVTARSTREPRSADRGVEGSVAGKTVLVTGSDGFIGIARRRAAARRRRARAGLLPLQLQRVDGLARRVRRVPRRRARRAGRGRARRHPRPRARHGDDRGRRRRAAPRGAHRDPVLLRGAPLLRRDQRHRHAQRARGRAPPRHAADGQHVDLRGLRHARVGADHRGAPAARPVALLGDEDLGRQDVRVVRAVLRDAGDDAAAVQHLRSAPVDARRHPDRAVAAARRARPSSGSAT